MPASDLSLLIEAARKAGEVAAGFAAAAAKRWAEPGGPGPGNGGGRAENHPVAGGRRGGRPG